MNDEKLLFAPLAAELDWTKFGLALRASADDAHDGDTPSVDIAYSFLLDNPECFGYEEWPADMPQQPNIQLIAAYYDSSYPADERTSDPNLKPASIQTNKKD